MRAWEGTGMTRSAWYLPAEYKWNRYQRFPVTPADENHAQESQRSEDDFGPEGAVY
jgi:hypothetical protein